MVCFKIGYVELKCKQLEELAELISENEDIEQASSINWDAPEIEVECSRDAIDFLYRHGYLDENEALKAKECDYIKFYCS